MPYAVISKPVAAMDCPPNLVDYDATVARFDWSAARAMLDGLPDGGLNVAFEAVDRHAAGVRSDHPALRLVGSDGTRTTLSYGALRDASCRFAHALRALGVAPGERVFVLCGRTVELYVAVLGAFRAGCTVCPLFAAFGPEPIATRMTLGDARVLVTTRGLYRRKVAGLRPRLPGLRHVVLTDADAEDSEPGTYAWSALVETQPADYLLHPTRADDIALLHFTSGTTGKPKGALHAHEAVLTHHVTGYYALDLHPDDVFWCTADPGWVTGMSYGIIAPLTHGVSNVVVEAEFDAATWYGILASERVTVWYTAPTAIRMLMKLGAGALAGYDLSALRFMASVGEPLNPEAVVWANDAFGMPFHDNWWQTETGGIMIANYRALDVKPGSMGRPLPGIDAAIVGRAADGSVTVIEEPGREGELALKRGWPSLMRDYLDEHERYERCFAGDWYLTGDLARRDADGYYWFVGRADDVIKSAGHLIGPFEVESALMEHPTVAEVGVIGVPDEVAGEQVRAYVALKPGHVPSLELNRELLGHARKRLGAAVAPKSIEFRENLPKTRSGKIMRRLLKARALGLPEGDISTLESDER
ncbi:MAG: acetate--CoA ligase [Gammaproteobacteria bacterium]